jgi:hypothetical protein
MEQGNIVTHYNGGVPLGAIQPIQPIRHSGFAVLQICLSYFELIGSVLGEGRSSRKDFGTGARDVFPWLRDGSPGNKELLKRLYDGARCGLYHPGRIRRGIGLGQPQDGNPIAIDSVSSDVVVSPEILPRALKAHLEDFKRRLIDPAERSLRAAFERRFDAGFP